MMNHKKLLLTLTLCLCALLCMAVTASADDHSDHPLCEGTKCTDPAHNGNNHGSVTFEKVLASNNDVLQINGSEAKKYNDGYNDIGYELTDGKYYLNANLSLNAGLCITGDVVLCLDGHDIIIKGGKNVVRIQKSGSLTLCDCKGTGRLTSRGGRGLDFSGDGFNRGTGTFIMYGGSITGCNAKGSEGVCLTGNCTFTMYGGSITDNSAEETGAGVSVWDDCTFNMYGGSITGNQAQKKGGGVMVNGGAFHMYGGSITGNNSQYNFGDYGGGGVYVDSGATITLSGSVQIKDNFKGGQLEGGVYVQGSGSPSNLYLTNNKEIAVDGSLTGSSIGVTTATEPSAGSNVTFAVGSENTIMTGIFTPDTAGVLVGVAANGTNAYLYQCPHTGNKSTTLCTDWDYHWYECSVCGGVVDKEAHDYSKKVESADYLKESATCKKRGTYYFSCVKCGASCGDAWRIKPENSTFEGDYGPHDLTHHVAQPATCTAVGWEAYDTCSRCTYTTYKEIPAAHTYGETWVKGQDGHWKVCEVCKGQSEVEPHNWKDATTSAPKTCKICGATTGTKLSAYYYYSPAKTEDTTDSPKAGDPGVLLYAGLALTSLAGMAYTAKKRH